MCLRLEMTSWLNELGDVVWVTNDLIEVWRLCMRYALRLFVLLKQDAAHLIVIYLNSECDIRVRHPDISTTEPSPKKYYYKTSTPLLGAFHIISICGPLGLVKYAISGSLSEVDNRWVAAVKTRKLGGFRRKEYRVSSEPKHSLLAGDQRRVFANTSNT
jgi:hypothetical protein